MHDARTYLFWALRKLKVIDRRNNLEALNYQGVQIAKEVAAEGNYFLAGNISTHGYTGEFKFKVHHINKWRT